MIDNTNDENQIGVFLAVYGILIQQIIKGMIVISALIILPGNTKLQR